MGQSHDLIQCADHKWAPWSLACVHLVNGAPDWTAVPNDDSPEVDLDWLCIECHRKHPEVDVDDLRAICIHCVRELQTKAGVADDFGDTD